MFNSEASPNTDGSVSATTETETPGAIEEVVDSNQGNLSSETTSEQPLELDSEVQEPIVELDTEKTKDFAKEDVVFDRASIRPSLVDFVAFNTFVKWPQFHEAFEMLGDRARFRHVVAAFNVLQNILPRAPDEFLNRISKIAIRDMESARPAIMSRFFYHCAKMRYTDSNLMQAMAEKIIKDRYEMEMDGASIGTMIYSIAILSRFQILVFAAEKGMRIVDLYQLYSTETPPILFPLQPELIKTLAKELAAPHRLAGFNEVELANCVYGLGLLRAPEQAALKTLAQEVAGSHRLVKFSPNEISNIVYGFGLVQFKHHSMLHEMSDHLVRTQRTVELETQHISNILYGFSRLEFRYRPILKALVREIKQPERLRRFREQELANIVSSAALLSIEDPAMFKLLGREIIKPTRLPKFMEHNFSTIILGMANAGIRDSVVLKALASEMCQPERLPNYTSKDICDVIMGFNNLEFMDDGFMLGMVSELRRPLRIKKTDMRVWQSCRAHVFSWSLAFPF